uniref:Uncharacterized protein n=1 Tax=Arundo donax TaxID=35708 RepID=A0A0A9A4D0_ARUDO
MLTHFNDGKCSSMFFNSSSIFIAIKKGNFQVESTAQVTTCFPIRIISSHILNQ